MEEKHIRSFNFDLDTNALKKYYPSADYKKAYSDIKNFLLSNGFEHRQWSGYKSILPLYDREVANIIYEMKLQFSWLEKCVNKFDVANISNLYDLTFIIKDSTSLNLEVENDKKMTLTELLTDANKKIKNNNINRNIKKQKSKDNSIDL